MGVTSLLESAGKVPASAGARCRASGALPVVGHEVVEFQKNPFELLQRRGMEGGELKENELLRQPTWPWTGPEANEAFFRAPDDQPGCREAYKLMTPIFGKGVVFDAPGSRLDEQMRMRCLLREVPMRAYPPLVAEETQKMLATLATRASLLSSCKEPSSTPRRAASWARTCAPASTRGSSRPSTETSRRRSTRSLTSTRTLPIPTFGRVTSRGASGRAGVDDFDKARALGRACRRR
ncbi:MAG: hypothetical protein R3B99_28760 [Polyangiales bacterium]